MTRVSTADFIKNYGTLADRALQEPVTITKNGRDRLVVLSAGEFERLKKRDRRVVKLEEWTDADFKLMQDAVSALKDDGRDEELNGWRP